MIPEPDIALEIASDAIAWMQRIDPIKASSFATREYSLADAIRESMTGGATGGAPISLSFLVTRIIMHRFAGATIYDTELMHYGSGTKLMVRGQFWQLGSKVDFAFVKEEKAI